MHTTRVLMANGLLGRIRSTGDTGFSLTILWRTSTQRRPNYLTSTFNTLIFIECRTSTLLGHSDVTEMSQECHLTWRLRIVHEPYLILGTSSMFPSLVLPVIPVLIPTAINASHGSSTCVTPSAYVMLIIPDDEHFILLVSHWFLSIFLVDNAFARIYSNY